MLQVIKKNVPPNSSIILGKQMYLTLVRSHLCYASQLWRPHLVKDVRNLESVQQRATKFILQDFTMDYKARLISLALLPVSMWLGLQDILFLIKCIKDHSDNFNILDYVSIRNSSTRSSTKKMMYNHRRTTIGRHYAYGMHFHNLI